MNHQITPRKLADARATMQPMADQTPAAPARLYPLAVAGTLARCADSKSLRLALLVPLLVATIAAWSPARAHANAADTDRPVTASQPQLQLDHGQRWPADVALHDGMRRIQVVVTWMQHMQVDGTLSARQSRAATASIEDSVASIVKHPSRGAGVDTNLHILLGRVLIADGPPQLLTALELYPRYFDDPGWQPAAHDPHPGH